MDSAIFSSFNTPQKLYISRSSGSRISYLRYPVPEKSVRDLSGTGSYYSCGMEKQICRDSGSTFPGFRPQTKTL